MIPLEEILIILGFTFIGTGALLILISMLIKLS